VYRVIGGGALEDSDHNHWIVWYHHHLLSHL
jgi:hypothetical protein